MRTEFYHQFQLLYVPTERVDCWSFYTPRGKLYLEKRLMDINK